TLTSATYSFQFVNGTLHIDPKTLTVGLTGNVSKTYDGTAATTLSSGNYSLTGVITGDTVALNNPAGTFADTPLRACKLLSHAARPGPCARAAKYAPPSAQAGAATGRISAKTLTAGLTGSVSKIYDGTAAASLSSGNYALTGVVPGDAVALNNPASGSYDSKT